MTVSIKDGFKFLGITIVTFCAVFVCTFFLNFYIDAKSVASLITDSQTLILYNAQMATAKFTCAISGGFLSLTAAVMLVFYIRLYVDANARKIGILKAMGYSDLRMALSFLVFGISVLAGTALGFGCGFAIIPTIYREMTVTGLPEIAVHFHASLFVLLVIVPTVVFSLLACGYAYFAVRRPVSQLLRGKAEKVVKPKTCKEKERSFLYEMCLKTLSAKKSLAFFVAFACFCFSSMVQMAYSMLDLSSVTMGLIILSIGLVLAVTSLLMAVTTLVNGNIKNIAVMKAFGYPMHICALAVLGGYCPVALFGFAVGTVYQYGLLSLMVNIVFKDVGEMPDYGFNIAVFFVTLAVFVILYALVMLFYCYRINRISVKTVMVEN